MIRWALACIFVVFSLSSVSARETIRLANNPALSPDGQWLAFDWNGDIWITSSAGGEAKPLTQHPGRDSHPKFSPDGKEISFVSDREGSLQVYTIPVEGGVPAQRTFHTAGSLLQEYAPDGKSLLIKATRDHFWRHGERFFTITLAPVGQAGKPDLRSAEHLLFDDYGDNGTLSPDGKKLLFSREGGAWWRKGNTGAGVSQIWMYDLETKTFSKLLHREFGSRWPLWQPDGKGFYYIAEHAKGSKLTEFRFDGASGRVLTTFKEGSVVFPAIARDGSRIVFRHLFDLYCIDTKTKEKTKRDLYHNSDRGVKKSETRVLTTASAAAFTQDGLEIAFIAGGDLWVMDTELREPKQITNTAEEESSPLFSADGQSIYYVANRGGEFAIMKATRKDPSKFWWQNRSFEQSVMLGFRERPFNLKLSPDGKKIGFVRAVKALDYLDLTNGEIVPVHYDWSMSDYDWSPDGKWIVASKQDEDFNRDIWIFAVDKKTKPFNLSRHPYAEFDPVWSPDGKRIAFAGRRASGEPGANISIVALQPEDDEITARDRKLDKALDKMKGRGKSGDDEPKLPKKSPGTTIEFDGLHERIQRVNLGEGLANTLFWSPDSKKLAFTGSYDGKSGTYTIDVGDSLTPKSLTTTVGSNPVWLKKGNQIVWLVAGIPTSTPGVAVAVSTEPAPTVTPKKGFGGKGKLPATGAGPAAPGGGYTFSVRQHVDLPARNAAVFDACWRIMRDHWYDAKLGNADWDAVRDRYRDMAAAAPDPETVQVCVQMMLGELNGSHLGFTLSTGSTPAQPTSPRDVTAHLGVRFDSSFAGPGLKIRDVLPGSPAEKKRSRLNPGETIFTIDGVAVSAASDLTRVLNGPLDREITLSVVGAAGKRDVTLRPITYATAQILLYEHWLHHNRKLVDQQSKGKFGYLHISAMSMPNFRKFEEELVSQGAGKDGLVIDVRENPGGSIADHLLTALAQPVHAITLPRGGGPGYPLDRKVYISWHKPIVVLCNQNSGSNAEIFSHAIKTLKRGQLVGVPTAGAVVSTGATQVMEFGTLRLPTRGWFTLNDGEDMEKHGAVPHHMLWLEPCTLPQGRDAQLQKALQVLQADVATWKARPQPKLKLSTERP